MIDYSLFPIPVEIKVLAQLISDYGVDVVICPPGDLRLPLRKISSYRLICNSLFEIAIVIGENVSISRIAKFTAVDLPAISVYQCSIPLADPRAVDKIVDHIKHS